MYKNQRKVTEREIGSNSSSTIIILILLLSNTEQISFVFFIEPSTLAAKNEVQSSSSSPPAKKPKVEAPSNKILPDEVQKYLTRKPMTSKALVKKFVKLKTDLNKGQVVAMLSVVLKSMPQIDKQKIKGKMYLSLRTD